MAEKMVDKVMRLMNKQKQIRNIAICAHIDHGKTTFSDNLLSGCGMMSEELAGKQLALDFHEDEKDRGITIDSASVSMVHAFEDKEYLINLIDTPGHVDFGGDVTRAMRAVDGSIVLVCASEGIMPQTETVLRQSLKEKVKPILFINKVDRLIKELQLTPEQMQQRFIKIIADVNKLIKQISPELGDKWQVSVQDGSVCFGSAFHNWAMSLKYMQKKGISFKEIIDAYKDGGEDYKQLKKKAPIHEVILDAVIEHLPPPDVAQGYRIPKLWHGDLESDEGKALMKCDPNGPMFFVITKIVVDPQAGEISAGRLFSGTLTKGMNVHLNMAGKPMRVQQVFIYNGAKREIVDNVPSGNIIGVAGLKAMPGETITVSPQEPFEKISHLFEPVVTKAIEAKRPSDLPKLIEVLRVVQKEDPSIKIEINEETGEHLMHGMGELHLEVIENRIIKEKKIDITTSPPIVVYRETITKPSEEVLGKSPNKHNHLFFRVEPLEENVIKAIKNDEIPEGRVKKKEQGIEIRDKLNELGWDSKTSPRVKDIYNGNMLLDMTRGIVHIGEIIEMVMDMFEDVMNGGPIAKEPCFKVKVMLMDCKLHEDAIHRGPGQLYPAVREGIRGAMRTATPLLFEPIQTLQFEAPDEYMGEISKLISNKRGQLLEMNQENNRVVVKAKMPVGEMFGLSNDLRSATGGRGSSSLVDQTFERLPDELQQRIIKQIRDRKGLTDAMLGA
ncbi:elongation factor EF-2 [Candidatus Woesearchaeota archaeon]|nr:elongation factor EF-2 [Candidatus Woesearchaeota archaeon]